MLVEARVGRGDAAERRPGHEADLGVEMREEADILVILTMEADLEPQSHTGPRAPRH